MGSSPPKLVLFRPRERAVEAQSEDRLPGLEYALGLTWTPCIGQRAP